MPEKNRPLLSPKERKWLQAEVSQGQEVLSGVILLISLMREENISLDVAYQQSLDATKSDSALDLHGNLAKAYEFLISEKGEVFKTVDPSRNRK